MGIAMSDTQHRQDMRLIKELGANFIRISHYPQDDAVLEMCDRLGLIAWEEIPVIDYVPLSDIYAENAATMLKDMIRWHRNHPSIAMWGYMNEILLKLPQNERSETIDRTLRLARRLEEILKSEDTTRMSAMAFHGNDIYDQCGLGDITRVKGWNLYHGWYGGELEGFEEFLARQHAAHPSAPIIVSEYGAGSDLRLHSLDPEPFDFSVEYQQKFLEHYIPVIELTDYVAGASHWNFIDFSSANRKESMPGINNKGLVTNDRRKKDVYYYFKAAWSNPDCDTVAHIAARDWPARTELSDSLGCVTRQIKAYTNLPEIAMRVNGGDLRLSQVSNYFAMFDVVLRDGDNTLEIFAPEDTVRPLDTFTVSLSVIPVRKGRIDLSTEELAVNVGSKCYFSSGYDGLVWLPDKQYSEGSLYGHGGGDPGTTQEIIGLTTDTPLLQSRLTGIDEYRFDVVDGDYEVEMLFADNAAPSSSSAYLLGHVDGNSGGEPAVGMDMMINGVKVEEGFAPALRSGLMSMVRLRHLAKVEGSCGLKISFLPVKGCVTSLSAIKVRKIGN